MLLLVLLAVLLQYLAVLLQVRTGQTWSNLVKPGQTWSNRRTRITSRTDSRRARAALLTAGAGRGGAGDARDPVRPPPPLLFSLPLTLLYSPPPRYATDGIGLKALQGIGEVPRPPAVSSPFPLRNPRTREQGASGFTRKSPPSSRLPTPNLLGGTRRVRLVREEGRDVSSQYGREGEGGGGGWPPRVVRARRDR